MVWQTPILKSLSAWIRHPGAMQSRYTAINKPVVLLPGVNHAQLSTGVMKEGAFDLEPEDMGCGQATEVVADALGLFLLAHRSSDRHALSLLPSSAASNTQTPFTSLCDLIWARSSQEGSITALQTACAGTFAWLSPFTEALGALQHLERTPVIPVHCSALLLSASRSAGRGPIDLNAAAHKRRVSLASSAHSLHRWPEACSAAPGAEIMPDNDLSRCRFPGQSMTRRQSLLHA